MIDINEPEPEEQQPSTYHFHIFNEGFRIRNTNKEGPTDLVIMPAFLDPTDPLSWTSYRNKQKVNGEGHHIFTQWIIRYYAYQFIGKIGHFLAPQTFDRNALDPIKAMYEAAKRNPEYYPILGLGPDGKKNTKDKLAYKQVMLAPAVKMYAVNAVCLNPTNEEDAGQSFIYPLRSTLVEGKHDNKELGLLHSLSIKNRNVDGKVDPSLFDAYYYWGDPTNIEGLLPYRAVKTEATPKTFAYFSMLPKEGDLVRGTNKMLETRQSLADSLNKNQSPSEVIEILIDIFQDYPKLITSAFESSFPGVKNLLKQSGIISSSTVHIPYSPAAVAPRAEPVAPRAEPVAPRAESVAAPVAAPVAAAAEVVVAAAEPKATAKEEDTFGTPAYIKKEADRIRKTLNEGLDFEVD